MFETQQSTHIFIPIKILRGHCAWNIILGLLYTCVLVHVGVWYFLTSNTHGWIAITKTLLGHVTLVKQYMLDTVAVIWYLEAIQYIYLSLPPSLSFSNIVFYVILMVKIVLVVVWQSVYVATA